MEQMLLRVSEVGQIIGLGKSKTYELIASGEIPSVRLGKSLRVPSDALKRWIGELQANGHQKSE